MSEEDPKDPKIPLYLKRAANPETTRREVLQFLSAFGAALFLPSVAQAQDPSPSYVYIPHGNIVAKALREPKWRQQLVSKPKLTLAQGGIVLGPDVQVIVVQDSMDLVHVVLPSIPGMRGPEDGIIADILYAFRHDQEFHQQLLTHPRAAFHEWTGATLPAGLQVVALIETPLNRVIQLPPAEVVGLNTPAEVQHASWGGDDGGGGWGGGGDDWSIEGTYESGQVCECISEGTDLETHLSGCCPQEPGETLSPTPDF